MDTVDRLTRSRMMATISGKNTAPELLVRKFLHRAGFRFRLHVQSLPGRPDIVLPRYRCVVNVHGCFWHQHPGCRYAYMPKSNRTFWRSKLRGNVERDAKNDRSLRALGWKVCTIWECEVRDPTRISKLISLITKHDPDAAG